MRLTKLLHSTACPTTCPTACPTSSSDIVFLMDGSGSVAAFDFWQMKTFVIEIIKRFRGTNTRVRDTRCYGAAPQQGPTESMGRSIEFLGYPSESMGRPDSALHCLTSLAGRPAVFGAAP